MCFAFPASAMPVPAQVDDPIGKDHVVEHPGLDEPVAGRAEIPLAGSTWLDDPDLVVQPIKAHITTATVRTMAPTTMATSIADVRCSRNGLSPMTAD